MSDQEPNFKFVGEVKKYQELYHYKLPAYSRKDVVHYLLPRMQSLAKIKTCNETRRLQNNSGMSYAEKARNDNNKTETESLPIAQIFTNFQNMYKQMENMAKQISNIFVNSNNQNSQ